MKECRLADSAGLRSPTAMSFLQYDPPLAEDNGVLQTVRLVEEGEAIAVARWYAPPDEGDGVVQLIDFRVEPAHGRRGHGRRLLAAVVEQCLIYHRLRRQTFRRMWMPLHQKRQVIARAFFLSQGFTHVSTLKEIAGDGDLLIYVRTFD